MKTKSQKPEVAAPAKVKKGEKKQDAATVKVVIAKGQKKNAIERNTKVKEKNFLYKYQLDAANAKMPEKKHKQMRSKMRRDLQLLVNAIIINKGPKQAEATKDFIAFYKKHYILNDFTLQSITNSGDELKQQDLTKVLAICKATLAGK